MARAQEFCSRGHKMSDTRGHCSSGSYCSVCKQKAQKQYQRSAKGKTAGRIRAKRWYDTHPVEAADIYRERDTGWTGTQWRLALEKQAGICAIENCDAAAICADHIEYGGEKLPREALCKYHNTHLHHYDKPRPELSAYVERHRDRLLGNPDFMMWETDSVLLTKKAA